MQHVRYNLPDCRRQLPLQAFVFGELLLILGRNLLRRFSLSLILSCVSIRLIVKYPTASTKSKVSMKLCLALPFSSLLLPLFFGSHFASLPSAFSDNCAYYLIDYTTKSRIVSSGFLIFCRFYRFFRLFCDIFPKTRLKNPNSFKNGAARVLKILIKKPLTASVTRSENRTANTPNVM